MSDAKAGARALAFVLPRMYLVHPASSLADALFGRNWLVTLGRARLGAFMRRGDALDCALRSAAASRGAGAITRIEIRADGRVSCLLMKS